MKSLHRDSMLTEIAQQRIKGAEVYRYRLEEEDVDLIKLESNGRAVTRKITADGDYGEYFERTLKAVNSLVEIMLIDTKIVISQFYDWRNRRTIYDIKLGSQAATALHFSDADLMIIPRENKGWLIDQARRIYQLGLRIEYGA